MLSSTGVPEFDIPPCGSQPSPRDMSSSCPCVLSPNCPQQEWERDLLRQVLPAWIPAACSPVLLLLLARVLEAEGGMGGEEPAVVLMGEP